MDRSEENALAGKLVVGDEGAWCTFCEEYSADLLAFVQYVFGCSRVWSEEIVQMAFVRCVRSISTYDPARGRLFPWLKAVARNEARSLLRDRQSGRAELLFSTIPQHVFESLAGAIDQTPLPDELLESTETQMLIRECLTELNTRYRQALVRKYVDGWKVAAIAADFNVSEKAAESLLSRAREAFKSIVLAKLTSRHLRSVEILE
jgi:RNA polymerase sigma-70 factor (ECF subfamily)